MFKAPDRELAISGRTSGSVRAPHHQIGRTKTGVLRHENRQLRMKLDRAIEEIEGLKMVE